MAVAAEPPPPRDPAAGRSRTPVVLAFVALLALAALGVAVGAAGIDAPGESAWPVLPVLVGVVVLAEYLVVRYRWGGQIVALTLVEAALAPLLYAFPVPVVVGSVVLAQALAAPLRRVAPVKSAFNVAQWALSAGCGAATLGLLAPAGEPSLGTVAALCAAFVVMAVINDLSFSVVLGLAERKGPRELARVLGPVVVPGWVVGLVLNIALGVLHVLAYAGHPLAVVLFGVPVVGLHLADRGSAGARAERTRLATLHRAATALAAPLDPRDGLPAFLREVAEGLGGRGAALVLDRPGDDPELHLHDPGRDGDPTAYLSLVRAAGDVTAVRLDGGSGSAPALRALGAGEALVAPLPGLPGGGLVVLDPVGLEDAVGGELPVLAALARETAESLSKSALLERLLVERALAERLAAEQAVARSVVEHLQAAVMPPRPEADGVELAVTYLPSDDHAPTGGDLYDWQRLPDGRLHVAVVDVLGHGVAATKDALAVVHALRLAAVDGTPLGGLVERADALLTALDPDLVATVVVVHYDPVTGRAQVVCGGHPPALHVRPDGTVVQLPAAGGAIGWPGAGSDTTAEVTLEPGDSLVLYTDGLVESRKDILEGMEALVQHAGAVARLPAAELADGLVERSLAGAQRRDDSLALVLRRVPVAAPRAEVRWRLPAETSQVPVVRRALQHWLEGSGVAADDVLLVASELLANAVAAARTEVVLEARADRDAVSLRVADDGGSGADLDERGRTLPSSAAERGRGMFIVRTLADDLDVVSGAGGTTVSCRVRLPLGTPEHADR